jgi:hypothetical protein
MGSKSTWREPWFVQIHGAVVSVSGKITAPTTVLPSGVIAFARYQLGVRTRSLGGSSSVAVSSFSDHRNGTLTLIQMVPS